MNRPIGIFDSGIGGLTVVKQLKKMLPREQLIYFGDTARIPYGTKSKRLIEQFATEDADFLIRHDVKMVVVACNTASSLAMDVLREHLQVPVIGVVEPGAEAAVSETKNGKVGVIGTSATINSGSYHRAVQSFNKDIQIFAKACPLLVPLVEEGWLEEDVTILTLQKYLGNMLEQDVDTLVLGCTHYPLLQNAIQRVTGPGVKLIDSGKETARVVLQTMKDHDLLSINKIADDEFYVSDIPVRFQEIGSAFLGEPIQNVERVDYESFIGIEKIEL